MSQGPNDGDGPQRGGQPQTGQGYQQSGQAQQGHQQQPRESSSGLDSNESAALSYILGWITGLIFYFIEDDDQYVRFHALQSILLSVVLIPLSFILGITFATGGAGLLTLFQLAGLALVVILMYKAYNGEWFQLPVIGGIAMDKSPPSQQPVGQQGQYQQGGQPQGSQQQGSQQQGGQPRGNHQQDGQPQGEQQSDSRDDTR